MAEHGSNVRAAVTTEQKVEGGERLVPINWKRRCELAERDLQASREETHKQREIAAAHWDALVESREEIRGLREVLERAAGTVESQWLLAEIEDALASPAPDRPEGEA